MPRESPDPPQWVALWLAHLLHDWNLDRFGGASGIRDAAALESALARPEGKFRYADPPPTLVDLAAAYAYGIAKGCPFNDANKRTAWSVAVTFLGANGVDLETIDDASIVVAMLRLSDGRMSEAEFAAWLRSRAR